MHIVHIIDTDDELHQAVMMSSREDFKTIWIVYPYLYGIWYRYINHKRHCRCSRFSFLRTVLGFCSKTTSALLAPLAPCVYLTHKNISPESIIYNTLCVRP